MACNFHADQTPTAMLRQLLIAGALASGLAAAHAEKADRNKPMAVEADKPGSIDLQRQVVVFNGNVVIAQGTLQLRAEHTEVRELPDGFRTAVASGTPGKPASFKQKRDGIDEWVEGVADRIEYDAKADTIRFVGNANVRRLRGGSTADEFSGALVMWDNNSEEFSVQGGAKSPANPTGRWRAVLAPRGDAAASAAGGASLKPSRTLGEPR